MTERAEITQAEMVALLEAAPDRVPTSFQFGGNRVWLTGPDSAFDTLRRLRSRDKEDHRG